MKKVHYYIFIFFLGSIGGWCGEFIYQILIGNGITSPGALSLPWCPIYGVAAVIISLMAHKGDNFILNTVEIAVVSLIDEYLAAWISEEIFNNRIWDYSDKFLNFQGRVCLSMTLIFVAVGLLSVYIIIPKAKKLYEKYTNKFMLTNYILIVIFILNIVVDSIIG